MVRRASSLGFESWWRRAESVGFCAHPIQLTGHDQFGRERVVWARCNNRRATVCPSCSDLYARDTWQLVHAGCHGGHHNIPTAIAGHPQVFTTLTAPSYGPVHGSAGTSVPRPRRTWRLSALSARKTLVVQHNPRALTPAWVSRCALTATTTPGTSCSPGTCPELWRRFTITLRRHLAATLRAVGADPGRCESASSKSSKCRPAPSHTFTPSSASTPPPAAATAIRATGDHRSAQPNSPP